MVGAMASFMSSTIVNVAVPEMSRHFALSQDRAQWIAAAFMVAMLPGLSVTPWLLARFGLRRTYGSAILLLMAGGLVGGFSGDFNLLIGMRAVEGFASGILQPIPSIVILRAFARKEQGSAMGIYGLGVVLAPASGPALGGVLVEYLGWRSIFFVVIPFGLVALALARALLPAASSFVQERRRLDWLGLAWLSAATVCILNGLSELRRASHAGPLLLMIVGLVLLAGFVLYQQRKQQSLIDMRIFRHRAFLMGAVVSFVYGFGIFGSTYLLPVFLQLALAYSPSQAGVVMLPAGIALALSMPIAGRMADRLPTRPLVVSGTLMLAISLALMAPVTPATPYLVVVGLVIVGRIGLAIVHPSLTLGSTRGMEAPELPQAMTTSSLMRQLGGSMGISATGIFLDWRLAAHGVEGATGGASAGALAAFAESFLSLAFVCAVSVIAAWFVKESDAAARVKR
jgi:EmrB/QacA subfamily drug resistance transporter